MARSLRLILDDWFDVAMIPYLNVLLLTPAAILLGYPLVALICSVIGLLITMFQFGGLIFLPMLIANFAGGAVAVMGLVAGNGA